MEDESLWLVSRINQTGKLCLLTKPWNRSTQLDHHHLIYGESCFSRYLNAVPGHPRIACSYFIRMMSCIFRIILHFMLCDVPWEGFALKKQPKSKYKEIGEHGTFTYLFRAAWLVQLLYFVFRTEPTSSPLEGDYFELIRWVVSII